MENKGVVGKVFALQSHPDIDVYDHIAEIVELYMTAKEEQKYLYFAKICPRN